MVVFHFFLLLSLACKADAFGTGIHQSERDIFSRSIIQSKLSCGDDQKTLDIVSRRKAIYSLIAAGTVTTVQPKAASARKPRDEVAEASPTSSSTVTISQGVGPGLLPLSMLTVGAASFASYFSKNDESVVSPLYKEPVPYGMREGRNYWNGIDLTAASAVSKSPSSSTMMKPKPSGRNETTVVDKNPKIKSSQSSNETAASNDIKSAFFIKSDSDSLPPTNLNEEVIKSVNSSNPKQLTTTSLKSLLGNYGMPKKTIAQDSGDTVDKSLQDQSTKALSTKPASYNEPLEPFAANNIELLEEVLSDDDRMVLEAQREAEEAERLLREAEAEAARLDQELAKLGISTSLLPLVKDEMESAKEDTPYWQEIEIDMKVLPNKNSTGELPLQADPKVVTKGSSNKDASPNTSGLTVPARTQLTPLKTTPVPFSKLAKNIPISRVNTPSRPINNSLQYLANLPKNTYESKANTPKAKQMISKPNEPAPSLSNDARVSTSARDTMKEITGGSLLTTAKVASNSKSSDTSIKEKSSNDTPINEKSTGTEMLQNTEVSEQTQLPQVPFSKLAKSIPPVSRVTATSKSPKVDSVQPVSRTTNLKDLLKSGAK